MGTKDEFVEQLKAKLDQWSAEIDQLEAKAREKKAQAAIDYQAQIAELKSKRDVAAEKLREVQGASGDAWENLKAGTQRIWDDLKNTVSESKDAFFEGMREQERRR